MSNVCGDDFLLLIITENKYKHAVNPALNIRDESGGRVDLYEHLRVDFSFKVSNHAIIVRRGFPSKSMV